MVAMNSTRKCSPLQIAFAVITRSGNFAPLHDERIALFREADSARNAAIPGDRISRVWVFEDDPRITIDGLRKEMNEYERLKAQKEEILQREREVLERPLLAKIDSLRLENRALTQQKAEFFAEFERLRSRADEAEQLLAACRMSRQQEVDALRSRIASLRGAALKLTRPWMYGGVTWKEWDELFSAIENAVTK